MRIAYLSMHWPRPASSGVGKKMLQQMKYWKNQGNETCFFSHMHPYPEMDELVPGKHVIYQQPPGKAGKVQTEFNRIGAARKVVDEIARFQPDLIYFRSAMYTFGIERLFSIAPVVLEINTVESSQHSQLGKVYSLYNSLTTALIRRRASGFVTVSRQIAAEFVSSGKPVAVIANGFDVTSVQPLPAPSNETPRFVFIGSPGNVWHGVEKLAALADACPDLSIDVVGYDALAGVERVPGNMILHGYLKTEAYTRILARAEASIGSLALHRIGVMEISPLKTRETLSYGLPQVLPYADTDLDDLEYDWLLKIPNQEDNVRTHAAALRDFAYRMRGKRADRDVVLARVDARDKELKRLAFFEQVLHPNA